MRAMALSWLGALQKMQRRAAASFRERRQPRFTGQ